MTRSPTRPSSIALPALAGALFLVAAPPASAAGCGASVQTGHGDSPLALAQRCGTTVQQLRLANPDLDLNRPLQGQIVRIPGGRPPTYIPEAVRRGAAPAPAPLTPFGQSPAYRRHQKSLSRGSSVERGAIYTIRPGDTLSAIARSANVPLDALLEANPGVKPRALAVGQKIVVPSMD